ncbi:hypothetical protein GCM10027074_30440 [Streptomyces deserti]
MVRSREKAGGRGAVQAALGAQVVVARRPHLQRQQVTGGGQHDPRELEGDRRVQPPRRDLDVLAGALRVLHDVRLLPAEVAQYPEGALRGDLTGPRDTPSCGRSLPCADRPNVRRSAGARRIWVRWWSSSGVGGGTTMMLYKVRLPVPDGYRS